MNDPSISFNGVRQAAAGVKKELLQAFSRVIASGTFLEGRENQKLEAALTRFLGGGTVTTCGSGHDALLLALQTLQLKPDDEIIVPANAYPTAFPVVLSGAKLVPSDVDENGQMDPAALERALTKRARVVVAVHLYGLVGNVAAIKAICTKCHLTLIEDCAQAFGATWKGKPVGTIGEIGCFSFYPTKNLGAAGDGGAVWTKNERAASFIQQAKAYGETVKYESQFVSGHSRLPELQAAGLRVFLGSLTQDLAQRRKVLQWYQEALGRARLGKHLRLLTSHPESVPAPHLLVVAVDQRDQLRSFLASREIPIIIHYPHPLHLVPAFAYLGKKRGAFPVAERLASGVLSLPFHQYLTKQEILYTANAIKSFFSLPA